ncbi:MAG: type II CAAX endopeptidase family protein [Niameybacter sp.]|uniref:CPBP family intramembrane glutamic endopeptidase n=2 Tax=Niameybacter sp. TaxID=2033640 RepID=UPI002FC6B2D3
MLENNKMLVAARTGSEPSLVSIILMPFVFTLLLSVGIGIASAVGIGLFGTTETAISMIYLQYMQYAISFAVAGGSILLYVALVEKRRVETVGFFKQGCVGSYLKGMAIAILGLVAIVSILQFQGEITLIASIPQLGKEGLIVGVLILTAWIIQGAAEEVLVRGYMLQSIATKYGLYKGIIFSSIVFALLHLGNSGVTAISLINILLCGLMLALLVLKEENLWAACGFHTAWNLFQGNVFGISVSGNVLDVSLFKTEMSIPTLWNGGAFGIEGSLLTTFFMLIVTGGLIWRLSKQVI